MDLRNLCSKIDMDSIRAKFSHMPAMPAMPQIKLPKSMPKFKSRKIFRSSHEDVSKASLKRPNQPSSLEVRQTHIKPADFINSTPTRISTISSLMQQHGKGSRRGGGGKTDSFEHYDSSTYRRANSIDEDYPSAATLHGALYPESPARTPVKRDAPSGATAAAKHNSPTITGSSGNVKMSLSEKMQKGYKDMTEFRFKHLLAKKTVVRSDNIEVDYYVQRYNEDRIVEEREQLQRDRDIADNFRFKFKESRQSTVRSNSISPSDSPVMQQSRKNAKQMEERGKAAQSDDESGMEATPPPRRLLDGGISKNPLRPLRRGQSQASNSDSNETDDKPQRAPIPSSLWAIKDKKNDQNATEKIVEPATTKKSYKERMRRLTSYVSSHDESGAESATEVSGNTTLSKLRNFGKRQHVEDEGNVGTDHEEEGREGGRAKFASQQSLNEKSAEKPLDAIKLNLKRFKSTMSLKRQPTPATNDTDDENVKVDTSPTSTRNKIAARLRRFKSRDVSSVDEADNDENTEVSKRSAHSSGGSPLRAAITNKLQAWKKSFKKKPEEANAAEVGTEDEDSPAAKPTRSSTLIKKLNYIRSRKNPNSNEELDAQEDEDVDKAVVATKKSNETSKSKAKNLEEKFENARQRTMKRVNDKMQKMKIFNKSQDNAGKEENDDTAAVTNSNVPPPISRRREICDDAYEENSSDNDDIEEISNQPDEYAATKKIHAVWTTQPILSDSTESDDNDGEYPRVLIHQDNSDIFESTLIIAVTTAAATASPRPKITEILSKDSPKARPKALNWVPNKETSSSFLDTTPPSERRTSVADKSDNPTARGHARKLSMDSNSDSDSWVPENVHAKPLSIISSREGTRRTSAAGLNSIQENEEPWRVHSAYPEDKLYKTRSIDIFAENIKGGAFEDFDDELKNEPVRKITRKSSSEDGKESIEDADAVDDDISSRVTEKRMESISVEERTELITCNTSSKPMHTTRDEYRNRQFGNSRESLDANFDENEEYTDDEDDYDDEDRPPSAAPSPPPTTSPPPPPLPQRQPSLRLPKPIVSAAEVMLPPLPATKPPLAPPAKQPPKIPERTESMSRITKPLVKTSSLRLAYTEQVKPADVGKVNKLISRFEQPTTATESAVRPRIRAKTLLRDESEDYSDSEEKEEEDDDSDIDDDDDDDNDDEDDYHVKENDINDNYCSSSHEATPTPLQKLPATQNSYNAGVEDTKPMTKKRIAPKPESILSKSAKTQQVPRNNSNEQESNNIGQAIKDLDECQETSNRNITRMNIPKLTLTSDIENNNPTQSQPSSEYGSPLEYPSSLISSAETTPTPGRRQQTDLRAPGRRARSMVRDDDQYYSFDSDEENSYYSISSTGSSRYVVEI